MANMLFLIRKCPYSVLKIYIGTETCAFRLGLVELTLECAPLDMVIAKDNISESGTNRSDCTSEFRLPAKISQRDDFFSMRPEELAEEQRRLKIKPWAELTSQTQLDYLIRCA